MKKKPGIVISKNLLTRRAVGVDADDVVGVLQSEVVLLGLEEALAPVAQQLSVVRRQLEGVGEVEEGLGVVVGLHALPGGLLQDLDLGFVHHFDTGFGME